MIPHLHDAGVQLHSGDTDHSPHLETALVHWDPVYSWPLQRTAGRCADISPPSEMEIYKICQIYEI
jgi:hypothetical protein